MCERNLSMAAIYIQCKKYKARNRVAVQVNSSDVDLRGYQQEDVSKLRHVLRQGAKRALFEASVGYGKSVVIYFLAVAYSAAGKRVWVLSNRSAVVDQLADRAGWLPGVTVMTVQAADRRKERLSKEPADLILIDEVHMGGAAAQYGRVMDCAPGAVSIGFTGTPKPETFSVFPAHVKGHDSKWLTERGFLAPLKYITPDVNDIIDMSGVRRRNGDYDPSAAIEALQQKKIYSNVIEDFRTYGLHVPTLGFCVNVQHAHDTAEIFRKAGHKCDVLIGKDSKQDVENKIAMLKDGGLLFSVDKVSAGFDLPDLRTLLLMRPTESEQLHVQQLGRAARAAAGKECGYIVDHVGNVHNQGTLTLQRDWLNLEATKGQRKTEDGRSLAIRQCDDCMAIFEAGPKVCPDCGVVLVKDQRISCDEAVRLKEQDADKIEAERKAMQDLKKRQGQPIRQMAAYLGYETAVRNMKNRYKKAVENNDDIVIAFAASELRKARVRV